MSSFPMSSSSPASPQKSRPRTRKQPRSGANPEALPAVLEASPVVLVNDGKPQASPTDKRRVETRTPAPDAPVPPSSATAQLPATHSLSDKQSKGKRLAKQSKVEKELLRKEPVASSDNTDEAKLDTIAEKQPQIDPTASVTDAKPHAPLSKKRRAGARLSPSSVTSPAPPVISNVGQPSTASQPSDKQPNGKAKAKETVSAALGNALSNGISPAHSASPSLSVLPNVEQPPTALQPSNKQPNRKGKAKGKSKETIEVEVSPPIVKLPGVESESGDEESAPPECIILTAPKNLRPTSPFDPRSILPKKKAGKTIADLQRSPLASKIGEYRCLDGNHRFVEPKPVFAQYTPTFTARTYDQEVANANHVSSSIHQETATATAKRRNAQSSRQKTSPPAPAQSSAPADFWPDQHPIPAPPTSSLETEIKNAREALAALEQKLKQVENDQPPVTATSYVKRKDGEQFEAFGIKAYPTRARISDICFDFVRPSRWCPHGTKCYRIHPLDKDAYLASVAEKQVLHARMTAAVAAGKTPTSSAQIAPSNNLHTKEGTAKATAPVTTELAPIASSSTIVASTTQSRPVAASSEDVQHWDRLQGLHSRTPSPSGSTSGHSQDSFRAAKYGSPSSTDCEDGEQRRRGKTRTEEGKVAALHRESREQIRSDSVSSEKKSPQPVKVKVHPRPRTSERCRVWLFYNNCPYGYDCKYIHDDLEYDDDDDETPAIPHLPVAKVSDYHVSLLHTHMRVKVAAGFAVEDISTGFESTVLMISNLPPDVQYSKVQAMLNVFGEVSDLKRKPVSQEPGGQFIVRAQFEKSEDAYRCFTELHGDRRFNRTLDVRMLTEGKENGSLIKDTTVQITFDYAHRTVYMGYDTLALAQAAAAKGRQTLYDEKYQVYAEVYQGIPAVGNVTVKFDYLPPDVTKEKMSVFGQHSDMAVVRPTYEDYDIAGNINRIQKLMKQFTSTMTDLEFKPPPYRYGKMRAWATFKTAKDAEIAAQNINGRKPIYTGKLPISALHIKTISFGVQRNRYLKVERDVRALADRIHRNSPGYSLNITNKPTLVSLRLIGTSLKFLGKLKAAVERTLNGEQILSDGKVVWDDWFRTINGLSYLRQLESDFGQVTVETDPFRRTMRVFGHREKRAWVAQSIVYKVDELGLRKWHKLNLDAPLVDLLTQGTLDGLRKRFGAENFRIEKWYHTLSIRGDDDMLAVVSDEVNTLRQKISSKSLEKKALRYECPVCLNEASPPVHVGCGHAFCRGCLKRYLTASMDQKFFPLTCLGNEGKCEQHIPLPIAKQLLTPDTFNAVVEAAFAAHVHTHPKELHFCPTPDCPQIYRAAREGIFIQCPSCLARICPNCHSDAHDGLSCSEAGSGDDLFNEWAGKHGVKQCPSCKMGIEKDAGCNHMVCTMCKTHICWVCSATFPNGNTIYAHMSTTHGGYGL